MQGCCWKAQGYWLSSSLLTRQLTWFLQNSSTCKNDTARQLAKHWWLTTQIFLKDKIKNCISWKVKMSQLVTTSISKSYVPDYSFWQKRKHKCLPLPKLQVQNIPTWIHTYTRNSRVVLSWIWHFGLQSNLNIGSPCLQLTIEKELLFLIKYSHTPFYYFQCIQSSLFFKILFIYF